MFQLEEISPVQCTEQANWMKT